MGYSCETWSVSLVSELVPLVAPHSMHAATEGCGSLTAGSQLWSEGAHPGAGNVNHCCQ